ncbi:hypothetical protein GGS24DRAFT_509005 [Hypoxylon argillaceum]|nr:hypothetical protein GGS24DRAFT_509005 [Hypoxylon argillaceum]
MGPITIFVLVVSILHVITEKLLPKFPGSIFGYVELRPLGPWPPKNTASIDSISSIEITNTPLSPTTPISTTASTSAITSETIPRVVESLATAVESSVTITPSIALKSDWLVDTPSQSLESVEYCNWTSIYNLGKTVRHPLNLLTEKDAIDLDKEASRVHNFLWELEQLAKAYPRQEKEAESLRELLDFFVMMQMRGGHEVIMDLQKQLADYAATKYWGRDSKEVVPLIDSALEKFRRPLGEPWAKLRGGDPSKTAKEALAVLFDDTYTGQYCLGGNCRWPRRIAQAWRRAEAIERSLEKILDGVKLQVLDADRKSQETLSYAAQELKWMVPLYIVILVVARLLAMGYPLAGHRELGPRDMQE